MTDAEGEREGGGGGGERGRSKTRKNVRWVVTRTPKTRGFTEFS